MLLRVIISPHHVSRSNWAFLLSRVQVWKVKTATLITMIVEKASVASWSNPATSFLRIGDEHDSPNNLFWWVYMKINRRNGKIKRETMKGKNIFSFMHSTITKSGLCICLMSFSKLRDFFFSPKLLYVWILLFVQNLGWYLWYD